MGNSQSQTSKSIFSLIKRKNLSSVKAIKQDDTEESEGLDFHKAKNKSPPNPSLPPSPIYTSNDAHNTKTIIVNGRRYQNFNTKYILTNDDEEQDRLVQAVHVNGEKKIKLYIFNVIFFWRSILSINIYSMAISQLLFVVYCRARYPLLDGVHRDQVKVTGKTFPRQGYWI